MRTLAPSARARERSTRAPSTSAATAAAASRRPIRRGEIGDRRAGGDAARGPVGQEDRDLGGHLNHSSCGRRRPRCRKGSAYRAAQRRLVVPASTARTPSRAAASRDAAPGRGLLVDGLDRARACRGRRRAGHARPRARRRPAPARPPAVEAVLGLLEHRVLPLPAECGSAGTAAPGGSRAGSWPSSRSRCTKTRLPSDFDIFSPAEADHPDVHPVADEPRARRRLGLGRLALVVREDEVAAPAVQVDRRAELAHARAPSTRCATPAGPGPTATPRTARPAPRAARGRSPAGRP